MKKDNIKQMNLIVEQTEQVGFKLQFAFVWKYTKEGAAYWCKIRNRLDELVIKGRKQEAKE